MKDECEKYRLTGAFDPEMEEKIRLKAMELYSDEERISLSLVNYSKILKETPVNRIRKKKNSGRQITGDPES
jgi:hypothetical protein